MPPEFYPFADGALQPGPVGFIIDDPDAVHHLHEFEVMSHDYTMSDPRLLLRGGIYRRQYCVLREIDYLEGEEHPELAEVLGAILLLSTLDGALELGLNYDPTKGFWDQAGPNGMVSAERIPGDEWTLRGKGEITAQRCAVFSPSSKAGFATIAGYIELPVPSFLELELEEGVAESFRPPPEG